MEKSTLMSVGYPGAGVRRALNCAWLVVARARRTQTPIFDATRGGAVSDHSPRPTGDSAPSGNLVV